MAEDSLGQAGAAPFSVKLPPKGGLRGAARFIERKGFVLLMPHRGLAMPTLWEAIRGRPGGHPFRPWTEHSDLLWEWKDELPARRLAFYGSIWAGRPGFVSLSLLPVLMRLWGCPLGSDGFRVAYREGRMSFNANRLCETMLVRGAMNTYRLRTFSGLNPNSFKRALVELQRKLIVAKCGADDRDTTWPAEIVDLSARVFPRAHTEARTVNFMAARDLALATMREHAPGLEPKQIARLLHTGAG